MEKVDWNLSENQKMKEYRWKHHDSTEWMDKIAEAMCKVKNDPNLSYEEKRKMLDDYRKAIGSVN